MYQTARSQREFYGSKAKEDQKTGRSKSLMAPVVRNRFSPKRHACLMGLIKRHLIKTIQKSIQLKLIKP